MPTTPQELQSFQQYATARLLDGGASLELDELLEEWRNQYPDPKQLQEDVFAVQAAIRAMEGGETGRPAEDVVRELREKHNLTGI